MSHKIEKIISSLLTATLMYGLLMSLSLIVRYLSLLPFKYASLWSLGAPALGSSLPGLLALSGMILTKVWSTGSVTLLFVAILKFFYLPSAGATFFWYSSFRGLLSLVSLSCIGLFWLHPVGWQAAPYALYWVIPTLVWVLGKRSLWATALGSTFVAHALGSILFLYATPVAPSYWLSLIPYVALERLAAVGIMISCTKIASFIEKKVQKIVGALVRYISVPTLLALRAL